MSLKELNRFCRAAGVCFPLVSTCSFSQWCRAHILLPTFGSSGLRPTAVPGWLCLLSRWLFKWIWAQETKSNNFKISLNQTLKLNPLSKRCAIHFQVDDKWHCIYHPLHRITTVYVWSTVKLECWPYQRFWVWWILFGKITTHFFPVNNFSGWEYVIRIGRCSRNYPEPQIRRDSSVPLCILNNSPNFSEPQFRDLL